MNILIPEKQILFNGSLAERGMRVKSPFDIIFVKRKRVEKLISLFGYELGVSLIINIASISISNFYGGDWKLINNFEFGITV